ncbi:uncharacterized protein VICG_01953 [Vittaforma corneae ATCC 50505]|uniref:choline-phosphate cytidylyltransferase n=1 Tax=Vittaforma corneae (strain ATCC 50505) TaxID=993615 RepID=L2GK35_VITCO|nr:uncharacterized protein VICG_01953 [Vittaforma corneae ATCC 50505]ELA40994.1 hypothetical protein VICG_01953 [Vittaforma corneae ATCC 50505]
MLKREFILAKPNYPTDDRYEDVIFAEKEYKIPVDRHVRIYCDGIFDLFHYGHARLFSQVKALFPNVQVIVGICSDELTTKFKGSLVMSERERYESVLHCKYVDEVIEDAPWVLDMEFLEKHRIDYVAHDELPYAHIGTNDVYELVKSKGMFIPTKRARKISTTGLITRIIRDYELFLRRQVLRGISYKDLNISILKREQIKLQNSLVSDVKCMKEEFKLALCYWENLSKTMIQKFKASFFKNHRSDKENLFARIFRVGESIKTPLKE